MKIKVAIVDKSSTYLKRMSIAFAAAYPEDLEIHAFTDLDMALNQVASDKLGVLLVSDAFEVETRRIPSFCAFAYLVNDKNIVTLRDEIAVCRFQEVDEYCKQIKNLYSDKASQKIGIRRGNGTSKIIAFCSPSGGVGCSTIAAACSVYLASRNHKVLHLDIQKFSSVDMFFNGPGQNGMSDIIFAVKGNTVNLRLKLQGCVRKDPEYGVYFYSGANLALDMAELTADDIIQLLTELTDQAHGYDYIVLDTDFSLEPAMIEIYHKVHELVFVGNASVLSNHKIKQAYRAISILEENADAPLTNRMYLVSNGVHTMHSYKLGIPELKNLGDTVFYRGGTPVETVVAILKDPALNPGFDPLL